MGKTGDVVSYPRFSGVVIMDELPHVSAEKLKVFLHGQVDVLAEQVMAAMNAAKPGRLIADTEEQVRDLGKEFIRAAFEAAVQQKVIAAEAAFSPSARRGDGQEVS
jgi:hypothetical protein